MGDRVSWYIDGRPVRFSGWSADCVAQGGFRDFQGVAQGDILFAEQEAPVAGFRRDGSPFWFGKMTLDPEVTEGGATIQAEGLYKGSFSTKTGRRFFMTRTETQFQAMDAKAYGYPTPGNAYSLKAYPGVMKAVGQKGEDVVVGDLDGLVLWVEGVTLTNISGELSGNNQTGAQTKWRIMTASGPSGARTQEGADISSAATSFSQALTATSGDLVNLMIRRDTNPVTLNQTLRAFVKNIEVRGLATSSVFLASDVFSVILSIDNGVPVVGVSSLDVMPLDFTGTDFELALYMAQVADWWFMILNTDEAGTHSAAGPWADEVQIARKRNARTQLTPLRRYNSVRVPWTTVTDDERFAVGVAEPDPFPFQTVEYMSEPLPDKFPSDSAVPQGIADTLVARYSRVRRSGSVDVAEAIAGGKRLSPYEVRPGILASITDHDPVIPPQRVQAVAWDSSGRASLTIEVEGGAVAQLKSASGETKPPPPKRKNR